mgnify:CR=1 FL=1
MQLRNGCMWGNSALFSLKVLSRPRYFLVIWSVYFLITLENNVSANAASALRHV